MSNAKAWAKANGFQVILRRNAQGTFMVGEDGPEAIQFDAVSAPASSTERRPARRAAIRKLALREEIRQLRAEQAAQHREAMAANYDANDRAASKVVDGQERGRVA